MRKELAILFRLNTLTIVYGDKSYTIDRGTHRYDEIVEAMKIAKLSNPNISDEDLFNKIESLLDNRTKLNELEKYGFTIKNEGDIQKIYYKDIELPLFTQKIILQMTYDNSISIVSESIKNFFEKVLNNPDNRIREQLFGFLESANLPLLTNGNFLAYKVVRHDLKSIHDGKTRHVVGEYLSMDRSLCNPDPEQTCSTGLHFCSEEYIPSYMDIHRNDKVLMLEIDPRDVVSIPIDYNFSKGRACRYLVKSVIEPNSIQGLSILDKDRLEEVSVNDFISSFSIFDEDGNILVEGRLEDILSKEAYQDFMSRVKDKQYSQDELGDQDDGDDDLYQNDTLKNATDNLNSEFTNMNYEIFNAIKFIVSNINEKYTIEYMKYLRRLAAPGKNLLDTITDINRTLSIAGITNELDKRQELLEKIIMYIRDKNKDHLVNDGSLILDDILFENYLHELVNILKPDLVSHI